MTARKAVVVYGRKVKVELTLERHVGGMLRVSDYKGNVWLYIRVPLPRSDELSGSLVSHGAYSSYRGDY